MLELHTAGDAWGCAVHVTAPSLSRKISVAIFHKSGTNLRIRVGLAKRFGSLGLIPGVSTPVAKALGSG